MCGVEWSCIKSFVNSRINSKEGMMMHLVLLNVTSILDNHIRNKFSVSREAKLRQQNKPRKAVKALGTVISK